MLRYKPKRESQAMVFWDVRIWFKPNATVRDYIQEIKNASPFQKGIEPQKLIWIYSNGFVVGYVKFTSNNENEFYNRKNLDVWDAQVLRCELVANSAEYLYRIWTKNDVEAEYEKMRPIVPNMLLNNNYVTTEGR